MSRPDKKRKELESDPRFPSGPWVGFFTQPIIPGKHLMELQLEFCQGTVNGVGRDWVGHFTLRGQYTLEDGKCYWTKRYLGKHDVFYQGYNEGKGIWGTWEIPPEQNLGVQARGGFHIWPENMNDPTGEHLTEAVEAPAPAEELVEVGNENVAEVVRLQPSLKSHDFSYSNRDGAGAGR